MANEFNFIGPTVNDEDKVLFFGPLSPDDGPFITTEANWTLAHVMHAAGIFSSIKQAKSNGWDKPIPPGYSEFTVTKRKVKIYVLVAL